MCGTLAKFERLANQIRSNRLVIASTEYFQVERADYYWGQAPDPPTAPRANTVRREVARVCAAIKAGEPPGAALLEDLHRAGWIRQLDEVPPEAIKFFIAVQETPGDGAAKHTGRALKEFFGKGALPVYNVSIYSGQPFARYLVKGLVRTYDDIFLCIDAFMRNQAFEDLRCTTYLAANRHSPESDHIDNEWRDPEGEILELYQALGADYLRPLATLGNADRHEVAGLVMRYGDLLETEFAPYAREAFTARIQESMQYLRRALLAITDVENALQQLMRRLAQDYLGKTWVQELQALASERKLSGDPKRMALSATVTLLSGLGDKTPQCAEELTSTLGDDWTKKLGNIVGIRNEMAHGRLGPSRRLSNQEWKHITQCLLDIGQIYNSVVPLGLEASE